MLELTVNGKKVSTEAAGDTPLLWVIRDSLGLTGTKFGCGIGQCGACTVHVDGEPRRSCLTPASDVVGRDITTIEAVNGTLEGRAIQAAWIALDVVQCGYCQSGQIMTATNLLATISKPTDSDIDNAMAGNICRCATYGRIRAAIKQASTSLASTVK